MTRPRKNQRAPVPASTRTELRGHAHPNTRLKEAHIRAIRHLYAETPVLQRELAVQFGLTRQAVNLIINRVNWRHL